MAGNDQLAARMTALVRAVLSEHSLHAALMRVAVLSARAVPALSGAGLTWAPGTRSAIVAASHDFARRLDQMQYRLGEGPSLQAYEAQRIVFAVPVAGGTDWPRFSAMALGERVRAVLAVPVSAGGSRLGTLSLYAHSADVFDGAAAAEAEMFAEHAAHVLACAQELAESRSAALNLRDALDSRAPIEQAKGILMAREHCDPQRAFDLLRAASQCSHVKLSEVARLLVDSAGRAVGPAGQLPGGEQPSAALMRQQVGQAVTGRPLDGQPGPSCAPRQPA